MLKRKQVINARIKLNIQRFADGEITYQVNVDNSKANKSISTLKQKSEGISKKLASIGKTMTATVTTPLLGLAVAGVKYNASMETYLANFTTLMKGNEKEASKLLGTLKEMAGTTPYETTDLVKATQKMMAFGISSKSSLKYLQMIGDIAMGDANKMDSISLAFSQISASGRASLEDINQMIDQGFNPLTIIAKKTGESMGKLRDRVSDGKVSFKEIADAMKTATSKGGIYFNSMDKASQTTAGKISTLKDDFNTALGTMTESLLPFVEKGVEGLSKLAQWFTTLNDEEKKNILKIAGLVASLGPLSIALSGLVSLGKNIILLGGGIGKSIVFLTSGAIKVISLLGSGIGKSILFLISGISKVISVMKSWHLLTKIVTGAQWLLNVALNANPIGLMVVAIVAVIAVLVLLWKKCEWFRNAVTAVMDYVVTTFKKRVNIVINCLKYLYEKFKERVNFAISVFKKLWSVAVSLATKIKNAYVTVGSAIKTVFSSVSRFVRGVFNSLINFVRSPVNTVIRGLNKIQLPKWVPGLGGKGINIPLLATGTNNVQREGLAYLHQGEAVVPKKYNPAVGGGSQSGPIYVNVIADMDVNKFGKAFVKDIKMFSGGAKNDYNFGGGR